MRFYLKLWKCGRCAHGIFHSRASKWDPHPIASLNFQILPHGGFLWEWNGEPAGMRLISWRIPENYINWPFHLLYPSAICRKNVILVNFLLRCFGLSRSALQLGHFSIYYTDAIFTTKPASKSIIFCAGFTTNTVPARYDRWKSRPKIYNLDRFSRFGTFPSIPGRLNARWLRQFPHLLCWH